MQEDELGWLQSLGCSVCKNVAPIYEHGVDVDTFLFGIVLHKNAIVNMWAAGYKKDFCTI